MLTTIALVDTPPAVQQDHLGIPALLVLMLVGCVAVMAWTRWVRPMNLAIGFAATVGMWAFSYVALLQPGRFAGELLFAGSAACLVLGGYVAGRRAAGQATGIGVGLVSATINLMVVGAFLRDEQGGGPWRSVAYVAGLYAWSALLAAIGERLGRRGGPGRPLPAAAGLMGMVLVANVLAMIVLGGLVTSFEAGLAVPDWPNSFGHNMLLYPVSEMKGGIFYEHAHRLFGMLVGVTAIAFASTAWRAGSNARLRWLSAAIMLAVVAQGVLGGLRVTGNLTASVDPRDLSPSTVLAIVHGMLGQAVLALSLLAALEAGGAFAGRPAHVAGARWVRLLPAIALAALVLQLFLGASTRHLQVPPTADAGARIPAWALHGHLAMSVVALVVVLLAGTRCARVTEDRAVRALGKALTHAVGLQFLLGIGALVAVLVRRGELVPWWEAVTTTAHQALGATLLAIAASLAVASRTNVSPSSGPA